MTILVRKDLRSRSVWGGWRGVGAQYIGEPGVTAAPKAEAVGFARERNEGCTGAVSGYEVRLYLFIANSTRFRCDLAP